MASPPPDQDQVLAPDQTHQQHIVRVKQSLADLIKRKVRGEDFYVDAEGLLAARETEEDEDIIEELHHGTYKPPGYIPVPWERRQIQDPDLRYITPEALTNLTNILESVKHLVRKPILIEKLATMLAQPRGIIRRDLKKLLKAYLMLPLSCWATIKRSAGWRNDGGRKLKGRFIWEKVMVPARILLGIIRAVRPLQQIQEHRWRIIMLQAMMELHTATRPADRGLQTALDMLDEACPAFALKNGLSNYQDTLLWIVARRHLLSNAHLDWPMRLKEFTQKHLGMDGKESWEAWGVDSQGFADLPSLNDDESDAEDRCHQLASWTKDD